MRLYKKAAVCLLAAAMSLCMLTACGGSGSSEKPADSKPGTSEGGEENPGEKPGENPGESSKDDGEDLPEEVRKAWNESLTKKVNATFASDSLQADVKAVRLYNNSNAESDGEQNYSVARSGEMYNLVMKMGTSSERFLLKDDKAYEIETSTSKKTVDIYSIKTEEGAEGEATIKMLYGLMLPQATPAAPECGTEEIDGKTYKTETFAGLVEYNGVSIPTKLTYCYDELDKLAYVIETYTVDKEQYTMRISYASLTTVVDADNFKVPTKEDGYTINDHTEEKDPDTGDGEETEDKLPTEWKDSYVMSFLRRTGISSTRGGAQAILWEEGSQVAQGIYAVDGDTVIIQFIENNKVQYAIEQYRGKYYQGVYSYENDGMTYTISWSEADDSQRLQFEAAQKVFKIPANNEPALSYNCKKLENGYYQEEVVLSGTKYTYTIKPSGYVYTISTTYGGHDYYTTIQRWSDRPLIPVPDVK